MSACSKPCRQWPQGRFPSVVDCNSLLARHAYHRVLRRLHYSYQLLVYYSVWLSVWSLNLIDKELRRRVLFCWVRPSIIQDWFNTPSHMLWMCMIMMVFGVRKISNSYAIQLSTVQMELLSMHINTLLFMSNSILNAFLGGATCNRQLLMLSLSLAWNVHSVSMQVPFQVLWSSPKFLNFSTS